MVIDFDWAPSTSAANLTDEQLGQLCTLWQMAAGSTSVPAVLGASAEKLAGTTALGVWVFGLFCVSLISACSAVGVLIMPWFSKSVYNQVITFFVGLGVGSLSGSSFYHLLPQAHPALMDEVDSLGRPTHNYLHMAHFSIMGVYMFFMCDKLIKIVLEMRKRRRECVPMVDNKTMWENGNGHNHKGSGELSNRSDAALLNGRLEEGGKTSDQIQMMQLEENACRSMGDQAHGVCVHDHAVDFVQGESAIAAVAWMIIFGDGFHNLIDGISIGASFSESYHAGLSISLAVLCEEFPHELGDIAILVASGMTLKQALMYNLMSAITCYIGFGIGVVVGDLGPDNAKYAFALAGGMFLYISLGCMMPEMKKAMEEALNVSFSHGLYVLFLQTCGLFSGLTLMYVMARYGEDITIPF